MAGLETIGFVGGGRVTRFLLTGWEKAGQLPDKVMVSDPAEEVIGKLTSDFPTLTRTDHQGAAGCALVVLAVHPPVLAAVLEEIEDVVTADAVVLSLVPKAPIAKLQSALGTPKVVRMIPNAAAAIGMGYNPKTTAKAVEPDVNARLDTLFAPWGACPEVEEQTLEAYAIISAMGPTYLWFQFQTLRELAGDFGLSPQAADEAILATVKGAAECLLSTGWTPDEVMDMIPVKPLAEHEQAIKEAYVGKLGALFTKLSPRGSAEKS